MRSSRSICAERPEGEAVGAYPGGLACLDWSGDICHDCHLRAGLKDEGLNGMGELSQ